jgi:hypothetical protein
MRRERDVLAQLAQELAIAAAEGLRLAARGHEDAEHPALGAQRRDHEGTQSSLGQRAGERERTGADVGLVHELTAHAAAEAVAVDGHPRLLGQRQLQRRLPAVRADARHGQHRRVRIVEADAAEIDRHVLLEVPDHHLEDAAQVLPLADGAGDPVEQIEPRKLPLQGRRRRLALRDLRRELIQHVIERIGQSAELVVAELRGSHRIVPPLGDGERRPPERLHGPRDLQLQRAPEKIREQHCDGRQGRRDQRVKGDRMAQRAQVPTQVEGA